MTKGKIEMKDVNSAIETHRIDRDGITLNTQKIAVAIPAYCEEKNIRGVLTSIPEYVDWIIVVDDASTDNTRQYVLEEQKRDNRIHCIIHNKNQGVGGATITGYKKAVELGAQVIVKMDGDGQMDPQKIKNLIYPLINYDADYTKGNRFFHVKDLKQMPTLRLLGNGILGFLVRICSGYWNLYDPTNGYTAIHSYIVQMLPLEKIHKRYFFESNMLLELYILRAKVKDIPIPSRYGSEQSSMNLFRVILTFPFLLFKGFVRRLVLSHILYNFTQVGLLFLIGLIFLIFGVTFGSVMWIQGYLTGVPATSGTVMLAALPSIIGCFMLIAAWISDLNMVPMESLIKEAIKNGVIEFDT